MKELGSILIKPQVKGTILAVFTVVIGVLTGFAVNKVSSLPWWISLGAVTILYLFILVKYAIIEGNKQLQLDELNALLGR